MMGSVTLWESAKSDSNGEVCSMAGRFRDCSFVVCGHAVPIASVH